MRVECVTPQVTLCLADNRDVLPHVGSVDIVLTDPPWSAYVHERSKTMSRVKGALRQRESGIDFAPVNNADELVGMCREWCTIARRWVVFTCDWKYMPALDDAGLLVRFGVGLKTNPMPQLSGDRPSAGWEAVAVCHRPAKHKRWNGNKGRRHPLCGKTHAAVWTMPMPRRDRIHPTQKSTQFYEALLSDFAEPGDVVLDPFMGSGATGMAAVCMGLSYVGVEKDEKYFNHALRRVTEAVRGMSLLRLGGEL